MNMTEKRRLFRFAMYCLTGIFLTVLLQPSAFASDAIRLKIKIKIDAVGNAKKQFTYQFPSQTYNQIKQDTDKAENVFIEFSAPPGWVEYEILSSRWLDGQRQVVVETFEKGYCKPKRAGSWEIRSGKIREGEVEIVSCNNSRAVLHGASVTGYGIASITVNFEFPDGAKNVATGYEDSKFLLTFDRTPSKTEIASAREKAEKEWSFDVKPHLMSSLAKLYGDAQLDAMWLGRSVFANSNADNITKFQVRYQLEGLSPWSSWKRTPVVYPGQSVVTAFHPILDIDQLRKFTGSRSAVLKTEYRYVDANGNKIEESDSKSISILDRNTAVFSDSDDIDATNWYIANNFAPMLISCYCNSQDPVVQQLAGRISGMADGPAASLSGGGAELYAFAIWKFIKDNNITVQASEQVKVNGRTGRRVKYVRDVLESRSGTPLDLAIFWATLAKAVGLETEIVIGNGQFIPVIQSPESGQIIPVDVSKTPSGKLAENVEAGAKAFRAIKAGDHFVINVNQFESQGARSLDLERVSEEFLSNLDFKFKPLPKKKAPEANTANR